MPSVLLIEDDIGAIAMLRRALSRSGYQVLVATNYPDALSSAEHEHPAAFLVSATLGGGDAAQLVESLRAIAPGLPLLLLGDDPGTGEKALSRPIQIAQLLEYLRRELSPLPESPEEPTAAPPTPATDSPPAATVPAAPTARGPSPARAPTPQPVPTPHVPPAAVPVDPDAQKRREAAIRAAELAARKRYEQAKAAAAATRASAEQALPERRAASAERVEPPEPPKPPAKPPAPSAPRPAEPPPATERPPPEARPEPRPEPAAEPPPEPKAVFPPPGLGVALEGRLGDTEVVELLAAGARSKLTGRLQLTEGAVTRTLFWDQGRIFGAASNSPDERLESLAYRRGLLTRDQQRLLRSEAETATRRLALLMVERAYIKAAELFPLVQERVEEIVYEACGQGSGRYAIDSQTVPDDERVALSRSAFALMTDGIRRKFLMDRLLARLSGPATLLRPRVGGPEIAELGLTARERRMSELVDGLRNIEELLFETGIDPLAGLKVLYALLLAGHVEIAVRGISADDPAEASLRIDLGRVDEKYEQIRSANYFDILGIAERATAYEVQHAYDRLSREFQPARFGGHNRADLAERLEEIQRVLAEARDVLSDERLRQDYGRHIRRE